MANNLNNSPLKNTLESLEKGKIHNEDYFTYLADLIGTLTHLTEKTNQKIEALHTSKKITEEERNQIMDLESRKDAIIYFAVKELQSEDVFNLANLMYLYLEQKKEGNVTITL